MTARLNTAETLALAVLKGDQDAIGPLLDCLSEQYREGNVYLRPLNQQGQVTDVGRLRAIFYVNDPDTTVDHPSVVSAYNRWLHEGRPLALVGVDRVEFYELPAHIDTTTHTPTTTRNLTGLELEHLAAQIPNPLVADRLATFTDDELRAELAHRGWTV